MEDLFDEKYGVHGDEAWEISRFDSDRMYELARKAKEVEKGNSIIICLYNDGEALTAAEAWDNAKFDDASLYRVIPIKDMVVHKKVFFYRQLFEEKFIKGYENVTYISMYGDTFVAWGFGEVVPENFEKVGVQGLRLPNDE